MSITYGNVRRAYKISKGRTSAVDVDDEIRKILQKEMVNTINDLFKARFPDFEKKDSDEGGVFSERRSPQGGGANNRRDPFDIDLLVASALVNGTHTTNILRSLFGLVPSLIGR